MKLWGQTHEGFVRKTNQDYYILRTLPEKNAAVIVVCDGMGGTKAGNVASKYAAESFTNELTENIKDDMTEQEILSLIQQALEHANTYVFELASRRDEFFGMGTTLVGGVIISNNVYLANVGDSRAYIVDEHKITRITTDHSLVFEMVHQGQLTEEQARNHPKRNIITRAVGIDEETEVDVFQYKMSEKEVLCLCTDGLTGMIEDTEIKEIIINTSNLQEACDKLINKANKAGGHDNVTVLLLSDVDKLVNSEENNG